MAMDFRKIAGVGASVGLLSLGLGKLYNAIVPEGGLTTVSFAIIDVNVGQQISAGIKTDLASRVLGFLSGANIPLPMALITSIIAGIIIVWLGVLAVGFVKGFGLPTGKTAMGQLAAVLFYGSLFGGVVVGLIGNSIDSTIPVLGTVIAMLIYYMIVAVVYGFAQGKIKQLPSL